jgi:hypothetical protein
MLIVYWTFVLKNDIVYHLFIVLACALRSVLSIFPQKILQGNAALGYVKMVENVTKSSSLIHVSVLKVLQEDTANLKQVSILN